MLHLPPPGQHVEPVPVQSDQLVSQGLLWHTYDMARPVRIDYRLDFVYRRIRPLDQLVLSGESPEAIEKTEKTWNQAENDQEAIDAATAEHDVFG